MMQADIIPFPHPVADAADDTLEIVAAIHVALRCREVIRDAREVESSNLHFIARKLAEYGRKSFSAVPDVDVKIHANTIALCECHRVQAPLCDNVLAGNAVRFESVTLEPRVSVKRRSVVA